MRKILIAALLLATPAAAATYGNPQGCARASGSDYPVGDELLVTETAIESAESVCTLPQPVDYSGEAMTISCWEGDAEFAGSVSLQLTQGALIYRDEFGEIILPACI